MVAHGNPKLTLDEFTELLSLVVGVVVFFTLVGLDTYKGLKKGLHWIPGDALILSALTIQLMNLLNGESTLLKQILDNPKALDGELIKNNLFMTHCSRVMVCVLVGYLLPGMARPGYEDSWGKLTAVGLIMFLHISSELFTVHQRLGHSKGLSLVHRSFYFWPHVNELTENSFIVSSLIISLSLVWLILLLCSATIANISIRNIMNQRIPLILEQRSNSGELNSWKAIENQVLKSWIVARGCYPEYIMARSVLASSAALAVTVCILSSVLAWIVQGPVIQIFFGAQFWLKLIISILEVIFSLVGWAIIGWRCIISVTYYKKLGTDKIHTWREYFQIDTWRKYFQVEDFWTRHILELQEAKDLKMRKREIDEWVSKIIVTEEKSMSLPSTLLRLVFWVQYVVVSFSKACGFLSELILCNRLMLRILSMLLSKHEDEVQKELLEYDAILENLNILGETPRSVFLANRKSIKQAKQILRKGNDNGKDCKELIEFLKTKMSPGCMGMQCLTQCETGLKFLYRSTDPHDTLALEKNFSFASKQSWKLAAVSLISLIVRLSPPCGANSLKLYLQASELMDLVDESNPENENLLSRAADRVYQTLCDQSRDSPAATTTIEEAAGKISELEEESKKDAEMNAEMIGHGRDSVDWKKAAAGNALYKLCKSIDCRSGGDFIQLLDQLQSALANIFGACINQVGATLVNSSKKWAQDMQERKLLEAVYVAGKSTGLMEEMGWSPNV